MKIVTAIRKNSGVTYHRISRPFERLRELGHEVHFLDGENTNLEEAMEGATHFVASRFFPVKNIGHFKAMAKVKGIKLIVDQDDHWKIPKWNPAHERYQKGISSMVMASMLHADEVWVTHEKLRKAALPFNKNVKIIPNAIHPEDEMWQDHQYPQYPLRFGYLGMASHQRDLEWSKANFEGLEGYTLNIFDGLFGKILKTDNLLKPIPATEYGNLYRHFDVSIVPLMPCQFNSMKSNLKMLEAGFAKKAAIVTNTPPYSQLIRPNENCIAVGPRMDFNRAMRNLSHQQAVDIAEGLYESVQPYQMDLINEKRLYHLQKPF